MYHRAIVPRNNHFQLKFHRLHDATIFFFFFFALASVWINVKITSANIRQHSYTALSSFAGGLNEQWRAKKKIFVEHTVMVLNFQT